MLTLLSYFLYKFVSKDLYKFAYISFLSIVIYSITHLIFLDSIGNTIQRTFRSGGKNLLSTNYTFTDIVTKRLCFKSFDEFPITDFKPPVLKKNYDIKYSFDCEKLQTSVLSSLEYRDRPHSFLLNLIIDNGLIGLIASIILIVTSTYLIFLKPYLFLPIFTCLTGSLLLTEPYLLFGLWVSFLISHNSSKITK